MKNCAGGEGGEEGGGAAAAAVAGCCGLLPPPVAESNKPKSGKAALVCPPSPAPCYSFCSSPSPCLLLPLSVLPHLVETLANKGVARAVKMSNYFAKMLHNSRVLCHQLTPLSLSPSLLPSQVVCLVAKVRAALHAPPECGICNMEIDSVTHLKPTLHKFIQQAPS